MKVYRKLDVLCFAGNPTMRQSQPGERRDDPRSPGHHTQSPWTRSPAPNDPKRSQSTGAPSHHDPPEPKREGQEPGRRLRRSRIEVALCIDLLGLAFTNLTLCWITSLPYRDNDH